MTTDSINTADRAETFALDRDDLISGFALTAWADVWASKIERAQEHPERYEDLPNLSQCEITEVCPDPVPDEFREWAREVIDLVLTHVPDETLQEWGEYEDPRYPTSDRVGSDLYLDSVGHGAGLADRGLSTVRECGDGLNTGPLGSFGILSAPDWDLPTKDGRIYEDE